MHVSVSSCNCIVTKHILLACCSIVMLTPPYGRSARCAASEVVGFGQHLERVARATLTKSARKLHLAVPAAPRTHRQKCQPEVTWLMHRPCKRIKAGVSQLALRRALQVSGAPEAALWTFKGRDEQLPEVRYVHQQHRGGALQQHAAFSCTRPDHNGSMCASPADMLLFSVHSSKGRPKSRTGTVNWCEVQTEVQGGMSP